ncbi:unnamed protein product [Cuscuta epithymum]|uniref:Uncharacterized protein n=1 Tax=Cuscuta epithymum TaxID=186058 RepID=A0AAV0EMJ5_9ASTE|nr:unnamed protein product [Cuscuta epithymum]
MSFSSQFAQTSAITPPPAAAAAPNRTPTAAAPNRTPPAAAVPNRSPNRTQNQSMADPAPAAASGNGSDEVLRKKLGWRKFFGLKGKFRKLEICFLI